MPSDSPVVRVHDLTKRYGTRVANEGIGFEVTRGEIYGVIGPDGAGKSTLLKAIAGMLTFDEGQVETFGIPIDSERAADAIKGRLGFMPQGLGLHLYAELSVEENIDFVARVRLVSARDLDARKGRLLAVTHLDSSRDRLVKQLSGGMKQKLGLICTLIHEPELIILDEPTTGVDPVSRRDFWTLLSELLRDRRTTAIVSTAYMDEATRFDRIALMFAGRMVAELTGDALSREHATVEDTFVAVLGRLGLGEPHHEPIRIPQPHIERPADALAIEAIDLTRGFGRSVAVDHVSFQIRTGQIVGLVGPNGAGKSTVIKMLTGLLTPNAGRARIAGVDIHLAPQTAKRHIGYMSQVFSLYRDLSVLENIRLYAGIYGLDGPTTRERVAWIVKMAGLEGREDSRTEDLSTGFRQRLALGCALVHSPSMLFLDEPTSGVDPIGRRRFWHTLSGLTREAGVAVLLTTHHLSEVEHCDRVGFMYQGRLIADAPPDELRRRVAAELGVSCAASLSMEDVFVHRITALERANAASSRSAA
jgi:ABC-2 type transport system ATP-binding protein